MEIDYRAGAVDLLRAAEEAVSVGDGDRVSALMGIADRYIALASGPVRESWQDRAAHLELLAAVRELLGKLDIYGLPVGAVEIRDRVRRLVEGGA